jgi:hypothetical protein
MLTTIEGLPDSVVGFEASGKVTADDYRDVLEPAVEAALKGAEKVRLLYVFDDDVTGMTAGAAWQDTKVGLGHYTRWEKVAVVTNREWLRHSVDIFGYLIPGEIKAFTVSEKSDALAWIAG